MNCARPLPLESPTDIQDLARLMNNSIVVLDPELSFQCSVGRYRTEFDDHSLGIVQVSSDGECAQHCYQYVVLMGQAIWAFRPGLESAGAPGCVPGLPTLHTEC